MVLPESPMLLCYSWGHDSNSTLIICSLSEQSQVGQKEASQYQTFEDWSQVHSMLRCTKLMSCKMDQQVEQIDSEVVGGAAYLCVTCTRQLRIFEIPLLKTSITCKWICQPVIHESPSKISHSKLRYPIIIIIVT